MRRLFTLPEYEGFSWFWDTNVPLAPAHRETLTATKDAFFCSIPAVRTMNATPGRRARSDADQALRFARVKWPDCDVLAENQMSRENALVHVLVRSHVVQVDEIHSRAAHSARARPDCAYR